MPGQAELDLVTVGKRLKAVRTSLKISLQDLAEEIEHSPVSLSNLETGKGVSWQVLFAVINFYQKKKIHVHNVFALDYNEEYLHDTGGNTPVSNQIIRRLDMINTEFSKEMVLLKDFVKRQVGSKKK